jgi:hypothetical protein
MRPLFAVGCLLVGVAAARADERRNWFDDPFFQFVAEQPGCPEPAGPRLTEAEQHAQAHGRAERGTSCWLAGDCARASAYAYDRGIAERLSTALGDGRAWAGASLWATVQRRFVFIEGCVPDATMATRLEALARALPEVDQAIVMVRTRPDQPPPYKTLAAH